ncbi:MAG TPA: hypothetical protein VJJ82_03060 [Candidatus Nanoarchaeia archaeon]|nr:hypothetical protein [Candidatus Nanoarchaeia archaeon]
MVLAPVLTAVFNLFSLQTRRTGLLEIKTGGVFFADPITGDFYFRQSISPCRVVDAIDAYARSLCHRGSSQEKQTAQLRYEELALFGSYAGAECWKGMRKAQLDWDEGRNYELMLNSNKENYSGLKREAA